MSVESLLAVVWEKLGVDVIKSDIMVGLWILLIFAGIGAAFRVGFDVMFFLLIPVVIVFMATGSISMGVGVVYLALAGVLLAFSWWQNR
jgi:hypothetical protein